MLVFNAQEQLLYDWLRASLPDWLFRDRQEIPYAIVKTMAHVADVMTWLNDMTFIRRSTGFWTDEHAKDAGTSRRAGEATPALIDRTISNENVVSRPALVAEADAILAANGVAGVSFIVNVQREGFYLDRSPLDRGVRMGRHPKPSSFVLVLPVGTTTVARAAAVEMLRKKAAGGFGAIVEVAT